MSSASSETDALALLELLRRRSFERREVTLSSGRRSNFYIDTKQVTLSAEGHVLIGKMLFQSIRGHEAKTGRRVAGVGGLTLGADPIASAVSLTSALEGHPIDAFIVRKEPKKHGTASFLEGVSHLSPGDELVIVEDVVTTGESAQKAIERVRDAGFRVDFVLALVDRLEGGGEALRGLGVEVVPLFDRRDFMGEPSPGEV